MDQYPLDASYHFRVNQEARKKFRAVCKEQGVSADRTLRRYMLEVIKKHREVARLKSVSDLIGENVLDYNEEVFGVTDRSWEAVADLDWTDFHPLLSEDNRVLAVIDGQVAPRVASERNLIFDDRLDVYRERPTWAEMEDPDLEGWVAEYGDLKLEVWFDDSEASLDPCWVYRVKKWGGTSYRYLDEDIADDRLEAIAQAEYHIREVG